MTSAETRPSFLIVSDKAVDAVRRLTKEPNTAQDASDAATKCLAQVPSGGVFTPSPTASSTPTGTNTGASSESASASGAASGQHSLTFIRSPWCALLSTVSLMVGAGFIIM